MIKCWSRGKPLVSCVRGRNCHLDVVFVAWTVTDCRDSPFDAHAHVICARYIELAPLALAELLQSRPSVQSSLHVGRC